MKKAKQMALGGILGAAAMTVMLLGGMIPMSTYVCPVVCMLVLQIVLNLCGRRIAWAWYVMVSILALLLGPDKEAAAMLVLLGYYPIIKPKMEKLPLPILWKTVFFNVVVAIMYTAVVKLLGLEAIVVENTWLGYGSLVLILLMGNATFFMLDKILTRFASGHFRRRKRTQK